MKVLSVAVAILMVGVIATSGVSDSEWAVFKARHGKSYGQREDYLRRMIYADNAQKIREHNQLFAQGLKSFYLAENEFVDMTNTEFVKTMNGYRQSAYRHAPNLFKLSNVSMPSTVDWRSKGYVTPVKNQGQCGSCWSFSTTGSLEGAHFKATGKLVSLSEENLMDCSSAYGNHGCNGGLMDDAFQYIIANKGIDTEASYPYQAEQGPCKYNPANSGATMTSYTDIPEGSEISLQQATATVGPISVAIDASHFSFQSYSGGVYNEPDCSSTALDHGVLVVGYGTENGQDYWLVKNSWGPKWGENGYIKMSRNRNNQCGIATKASYPVV